MYKSNNVQLPNWSTTRVGETIEESKANRSTPSLGYKLVIIGWCHVSPTQCANRKQRIPLAVYFLNILCFFCLADSMAIIATRMVFLSSRDYHLNFECTAVAVGYHEKEWKCHASDFQSSIRDHAASHLSFLIDGPFHKSLICCHYSNKCSAPGSHCHIGIRPSLKYNETGLWQDSSFILTACCTPH